MNTGNSKEGMTGYSQDREIDKILEQLSSNRGYLNPLDLKLLQFLATKGMYEEKRYDVRSADYVPFVSEVEKFNKTFNKPNNYTPVIPEEKEWRFVYDFIHEELEEYKEACENQDIVGVLDALADITYVSTGNGTMLHGLKDKLWDAYQEVQSSNMSKVCKTKRQAEQTVEIRSKEQGEPCHYEKAGDSYVVYRTRDRKVMKALDYFRPNLEKLFTEQELSNIKK